MFGTVRSARAMALAGASLGLAMSCVPLQSPGQTTQTAAQAPGAQDYLSPDLRQAVERLKNDVKLAPTTLTNYDKRFDVFWRWGNAAAKAGLEVDPAFPSAIAFGRRPDFATTATEAARNGNFEAVDGMIRELAWREANPAGIGKLTTPTPGPFIADSYTTIEQVYEVGAVPMTPGGGVLFTPYIYIGGIAFQTDDPKADNYLSVKASRADAKFELATKLVRPIMSGAITGAARERPFFRLVEGRLDPGDKVTVTIGDRSQGSMGYKTPNFQTSGLRMKVWIRHGAETPDIVLPEYQFPIIGLPEAVGVRGFGPSILATGECATISVRTEDRYRNRSSVSAPGYVLRLDGAELARLAPGGPNLQMLERVCFSSAGVKRISIATTDGSVTGEINPILVEDAPQSRIYWGETHGHSGFAEGNGTVDGYYTYARDDARLDFAGLSEHDLWMDDFEWEALRQGAAKYLREGAFVSLLGYEWTEQSAFGGHHNVFFRTNATRARVPVQEAPTLDPLYNRLKAENRADDVLVIPHAHMAGDYTKNDSDIERMVEIASNHGAFEWLGKAYLGQGHRIGFLGGSDSHTEHPGLRILRNDIAQSDFPGGLAAVYAPAKTTDAIFDALRQRTAYATNGARIVLRTTVNGSVGRETQLAAVTRIAGKVAGTAPIKSLTLVKNGEDVETRDFTQLTTAPGRSATLQLTLSSSSDPKQVRTQARETRDWSGVITVTGARVVSVTAPGHDNIFTESLKQDPSNPNRVELRLRTHGATKEVLLVLTDISPSASVKFQGEAGLGYSRANNDVVKFDETADLSKIAKTPLVKSISKLWPEDIFDLRFIAPATIRDRDFVFEDKSAPRIGDHYYVRVVQSDGGLAWSSATWIVP